MLISHMQVERRLLAMPDQSAATLYGQTVFRINQWYWRIDGENSLLLVSIDRLMRGFSHTKEDNDVPYFSQAAAEVLPRRHSSQTTDRPRPDSRPKRFARS